MYQDDTKKGKEDMKKKVITELDRFDANYGRLVEDCLEFGTVRLLGVFYKKWWKAYITPDGSIVIEYV